MRLFLVWGLLACLPSFGEPVGFENEYYYARRLFTSRDEIPHSLYLQILQLVPSLLGGSPATIEPWSREPQLPSAVSFDGQGRPWRVVPEYIHAKFRDGFELVAPPLVSDEDSHALYKILEHIEQEGDFRAGAKSSSHFTIGVDHLVAADGNASELVNAILFVESHWPEIYALFSPTRGGHRVNRYSVPLSADLPELFHELRALRAANCSFDRVKAVFQSYHSRELQLANEDPHKAWKFRALNYKRLFGLGGGESKRVVELRIPDLTTSDQLIPRLALVRALFTRGATLGQQLPRFVDRFAAAERGVERVAPHSVAEFLDTDPAQIAVLLTELKLRHEFFPLQPAAALTLRRGISQSTAKTLAVVPSGFASFGWEFEIRPPGQAVFVKGDAIDSDRFPFLSPFVGTEGTGNKEVRSVPTNDKNKAYEQMRRVRRAAGEFGRGFHFRIRVPRANLPNLPVDELHGWFARIGDSIWAWRLQNRLNSFALKSRTVNRPNVDFLQGRAAIRVQTLADGSLDIELRGLMTDIDEIQDYVDVVLAGLSHPELIKGFAAHQRSSMRGEVAEFVSQMAQKLYQRSLNRSEHLALQQLGLGATFAGAGNVPTWGLERAPFLTPLQRAKVNSAQGAFVLRALRIVTAGSDLDFNEAQIQFRIALKLFAADLDLHGLLKESLLIRAESLVADEPIRSLPVPRALRQSDVVTQPFAMAPAVRLPEPTQGIESETIPQQRSTRAAIERVQESFARGTITHRQQEEREDEIVRLDNTAYQLQIHSSPPPAPTAHQWLTRIRPKLGEWDTWFSSQLNLLDEQFKAQRIDLYQWEQQARGIIQRFAYGTFELHRMNLSDSVAQVPGPSQRSFVDDYCALVRNDVDTWYSEKVRFAQNEVAAGRMGTNVSAVAIAWPRYLTLVFHDHVQAILDGRGLSLIGRADLPYSTAPASGPSFPSATRGAAPFQLYLVNSSANVVLVADESAALLPSWRYTNAALSQTIRVHPSQPVEVHAINSSVSLRRVGNICMQLLEQNSSVSSY